MNRERTEKQPYRFFSVKSFMFLAVMAGGLMMFRIYGMETQHTNRNSIWWTERGRNLIPPTATKIRLRQDLLDHYATYTVSEEDLVDFLNKRFALGDVAFNSLQERTAISPERVGEKIQPMGWVITKDVVVYNCSASNGGSHDYYHDPITGQTYQTSAYW